MTDSVRVSEDAVGLPSRYIDVATADLNRLSRTFEDVQVLRKTSSMRLASALYGPREITDDERGVLAKHPEVLVFKPLEDLYSRELGKVLRKHPLYPWLKPFKGLAGARTGRLIAAIGDPHRWPGQRCSSCRTTFPAGWYEVGDPCPLTESTSGSDEMVGGGAGVGYASGSDTGGVPRPGTERSHGIVHARGVGAGVVVPPECDPVGGSCPGTILPVRPGTGTRSLWHYFGLMPGADGKLLRRHKGVQCDYSPALRALVLGEMGTADQIVRHRTQPYRGIYDQAKERLGVRAVQVAEIEIQRGPSQPLPPWKAHKIARTIAAKAFLADMLSEWKRVTS